MKMTRNILRRIELKIYHAMVAEQAKKSSSSEAVKSSKSGGEESFLSK
jgi:hypothetical protein